MFSENVYLFTKILCEFLNNGLSVKETFFALKDLKNISKKVNEGAKEIFDSLNRGSSFSNSIKNCSSIKFSGLYSSFIAVAEQTGLIKDTLEFLLKLEELKIKCKKDFISASIYPFFVMLLSFTGGIVLQRFSFLFPNSQCNANVFAEADIFLIMFCAAVVYIAGKIICETTEYEFYTAMSFLVSSGIDLITSLEICISIVQGKTKWEKLILRAIDELSSGKTACKVFSRFGKKASQIFEIENNCGQLEKAFVQIKNFKDEERKYQIKNLFVILEPLMLLGAASYLFILVKEIVVPLLFNYEKLFF